MRYLIYLAAPAILFTWMACGNAGADDKTSKKETVPAVLPGDSTVQPKNVTAGVDTIKPLKTDPSSPVIAGLNPAHGQPGHNCDIAVGAPLNSKPVQQPVASPTMPVTSPTTQTIQPAAVTTVAPGLNPAHGQPGHRCDIAVGASLNSKPSQQPVTTTTLPLTSPTPAKQPEATTKVATGINPAHGQPGHRCDIAVGAPLNSKPAQQPVTTTTLPLVTPIKPVTDSTGQKQ